jgi:hypothetical protein
MTFDEVCIELWTEYDDDSHGVLSAVDRLKKAHDLDIQEQGKRIAELEAQLPKVVKPVIKCGDCVCKCGWTVDDDDTRINFNYCAGCGSLLDWTEVGK